MGPKYICIHICQEIAILIYLYLNSPNAKCQNLNPNKFVLVFRPENNICHTLFQNNLQIPAYDCSHRIFLDLCLSNEDPTNLKRVTYVSLYCA